MTIQDLINQFEIQGKFCIKEWNEEICDCEVIAIGNDFECDKHNIEKDIMERKITYMYAIDNCLNIEVENV